MVACSYFKVQRYLIQDIDTNLTCLRTISYIQIPAYSTVAIPTRKTGKYITKTPCVFKVEINETIGIGNPI